MTIWQVTKQACRQTTACRYTPLGHSTKQRKKQHFWHSRPTLPHSQPLRAHHSRTLPQRKQTLGTRPSATQRGKLNETQSINFKQLKHINCNVEHSIKVQRNYCKKSYTASQQHRAQNQSTPTSFDQNTNHWQQWFDKKSRKQHHLTKHQRTAITDQ